MNIQGPCMAIVLKGLESPSPNAGKIVKVMSVAAPDEFFGPIWNVYSETGMEMVDDSIEHYIEMPDAWLKPVSGLPIDEDVTEDLKEPA